MLYTDSDLRTVKADSSLFRCKTRFSSVISGRIFMAFAALVQEDDVKKTGSFIEYKMDVRSVLAELAAGGDYYKRIKDAAYDLLDKKMEKKLGKSGFAVYTLFSKIVYEDGVITGAFHKDLVPFFLDVKRYTSFAFSQYVSLPSIYAQKLFVYLTSWKSVREHVASIEDLHHVLDPSETCKKDFRQLQVKVLKVAHKYITSLTGLQYTYEPIRQKRRVVAIRFTFTKGEKAQSAVSSPHTSAPPDASPRQSEAWPAMHECYAKHGPDCAGGHLDPWLCRVCKAAPHRAAED